MEHNTHYFSTNSKVLESDQQANQSKSHDNQVARVNRTGGYNTSQAKSFGVPNMTSWSTGSPEVQYRLKNVSKDQDKKNRYSIGVDCVKGCCSSLKKEPERNMGDSDTFKNNVHQSNLDKSYYLNRDSIGNYNDSYKYGYGYINRLIKEQKEQNPATILKEHFSQVSENWTISDSEASFTENEDDSELSEDGSDVSEDGSDFNEDENESSDEEESDEQELSSIDAIRYLNSKINALRSEEDGDDINVKEQSKPNSPEKDEGDDSDLVNEFEEEDSEENDSETCQVISKDEFMSQQKKRRLEKIDGPSESKKGKGLITMTPRQVISTAVGAGLIGSIGCISGLAFIGSRIANERP